MIHSFLLIGQSNMAGRGLLCEAPTEINPKINILRNGRWQPLFRPINPDRSFSGYCLAESFADDYAKEHPDSLVGLIPCADGGTTLDQWQEGGLLFDHAVYQVKLASRTSTVVGILWHQGENDCASASYSVYREKLSKIVAAFRKEPLLADVPFIAGGLGDYLPNCSEFPELIHYSKINKQLKAMAQEVPLFGYADATGLTCNNDNIHFNTRSLIEFGHRYYHIYRQLEPKDRIFAEKPNNLENRTAMEKL